MDSELEIARRAFDIITEQTNIDKLREIINVLNPNVIIPEKGINILHLAVGIDPIDYAETVTRLILCRDCNINERSKDGTTALHIACAWGRLVITKILLDHGPDVFSLDDDNKTPLDYAVENEHFEVVEYLTDYYEYEDACDSPDMYLMTLDKIVIDNGSYKGEYEATNDKDICDVVIDNANITKCSSDYQSCIETLSGQNSDRSKSYNMDSTTDDSDLDGIEPLKVSTVDENDPTPIKCDNFVLPASPYTHKNYFSTTTLKSLKEKSLNRFPSTLNITDNLSNVTSQLEVKSIVEEYKYEDVEAGIKLVEKRILPSLILQDNSSEKSPNSRCSSLLSLPSSFDYDSEKLRKELMSHGYNPGPITNTTKQLYLKKLYTIKNKPMTVKKPNNPNLKTFTVELEKSFKDDSWMSDLNKYTELESRVVKQFEEPSRRKWREGTVKSSFTYLLLDPRITENLPNRIGSLSRIELWKAFVNSIFYVGKGKRSRPYNHLYQAVSIYDSGRMQSGDRKIQYILDIWKENLGVVCLHVFQNVIPVEAYTREAAMIEVLNLKNLKNVLPGNYYGIASTWSLKEKKNFGLYLLYKAMLIFLSEGERQLKPCDIG